VRRILTQPVDDSRLPQERLSVASLVEVCTDWLHTGLMMTKATPSMKVFLGTFLSVVLVVPLSVVYAEQFYVGNTVYNACLNLPIFESPDRDARVMGSMKFGDSAKVASVHGKYELPDSDHASEAAQRARLPDRNEEDLLNKNLFRRISWAGFIGKGYASASCLVKQEFFAKQTPALAQAKVAKLGYSTGKHGFSEEEEGDLIAMQGAAGKAKRKRVLPNESSGEEYLNAFFAAYEFSDNTAFRQQGGLGEFTN
jgi:hypothetical protein